uniref:Uncharacterized protein n=1 Tax=Candidatus Kentrum eta TaxID=2126337 RepID=A0A450U8R3_9GAMM|nr:MAG: hypothetical protein BECKH772A_GA0070896_1000819 [Candidatus Kentron sp. H]VFJ93533.1 MAG: hypothetical protein BECKH772B_GA0070898_100469 [Candidatus Kentron sp. H]VFJ94864.1 MAG: hypothetical protein BECKH772C_GA0070978_1000129 [Candidatus Kentron sp. H]
MRIEQKFYGILRPRKVKRDIFITLQLDMALKSRFAFCVINIPLEALDGFIEIIRYFHQSPGAPEFWDRFPAVKRDNLEIRTVIPGDDNFLSIGHHSDKFRQSRLGFSQRQLMHMDLRKFIVGWVRVRLFRKAHRSISALA